MGNRHVVDGSLDFGQRKDVLHQLDNLCPGKLLDIRGNALNRAAQIAKAVGAERSDATFEVMQFSSADENEAPQDARYSRQESIEVRPLVPKGIFCVLPYSFSKEM